MPKISDPTYLSTQQYHNAANLNARVQLHARFSVNKSGWYEWLFDHFNLPAQSSILELGCGAGGLWLNNLQRIPANWHIVLSDFSPGMVGEAQQHLPQSRFEFKVIDAQSIPLDAHSFDAVIANHMLYHVPDISKVLAEICRVLKPGGGFYASTVGQTHLRELDELVNQVAPGAELFDGLQTQSFTLENGLAQLSPWFTQITSHHYEDALLITEAEPLVAYVLSTTAKSVLVDDRLAQFTHLIKQELAQHRVIRITKTSGLFVAKRKEQIWSDAK